MTPRQLPPPFDPGPSARLAVRVLKELGLNGALIGRVAMWSWLADDSQHEYTKDLDIAIRLIDAPLIRAWLKHNGLRLSELPIGGVKARHPTTGVNVDFIERSRRGDLSGLFGDAIKEARQSKRMIVVDDTGTGRLPLVSIEHLVTMKIGAGEKKDEQDARRLLEQVAVDTKRIRALVGRFLGVGSLNRFEAILRDLRHQDAQVETKRYRATE